MRKRNYKNEYSRRVVSGKAKGLTKQQAAGHTPKPDGYEKPIIKRRPKAWVRDIDYVDETGDPNWDNGEYITDAMKND